MEKLLRLLLNNKVNDSKINTITQFIKFGLVGFTNTIVNYLVYTVALICLRIYFNFLYDIVVAQTISYIISVYWSFCLNNRYVFKDDNNRRNYWKALIKSYISYSFTGLLLSSLLLLLWVNVLGISEFIAPIINLCITVPLNFIISKFWTFKNN